MVGYIPASAVRVNGYNAYEDLTSAAVTYKLASNVGDISFAIVLGDEAWNADGAAADLVPDNIGGDELSAHWGTQADRFVADLPPFDVLLSNVFFDTPSSARVEYRLESSRTGEAWRTGTVVETANGWRIATATFCSDLTLLGVACPPGVAAQGSAQ
jgi:hypothetical protein